MKTYACTFRRAFAVLLTIVMAMGVFSAFPLTVAAAPPGWITDQAVPTLGRVTVHGTSAGLDAAILSGPTFGARWFYPTSGSTHNVPFPIPFWNEFFVLNPGWEFDRVTDQTGAARMQGGSFLMNSGGGSLTYHFRRITGSLTVQTAVNNDIVHTHAISNIAVGLARAVTAYTNGFDTDNYTYTFTGWEVISGPGGAFANADSQNTTFTINVNAQPSTVSVVRANFTRAEIPSLTTHTVQFSSNAGGSITATVDDTNITSPYEVLAGETVVFTAVPDSGFQIASWSISGGTLTGEDTDGRRRVVNVQNPVTVTVTFEETTPPPPPAHTVQFSSNAGGNITATVDDTNITSPYEVLAGETVVFTAVPDSGFQIASWSISGGTLTGEDTDGRRRVVNVQNPVTVTVTFEAATPSGWVTTGSVPVTNRVVAYGTPASAFSSGPVFGSQWFYRTEGNTFNQQFPIPLVSEFFVLNPGWELDYVLDHGGTRRQPGGNTLLQIGGGTLVYYFRRITGTLTVQTAVNNGIVHTHNINNVPVGVARNIAPDASGFDTDGYDYTFTGWQVISGQGAFGNANSQNTTFAVNANTPSDYTVIVRANFTRTALPPPAVSVTAITISNDARRVNPGGTLTLTASVTPANATNQTIVWNVYNAGGTGASITGNTLSVTSAGTVTVRAAIANGIANGSAFTQTFTIYAVAQYDLTGDGAACTDDIITLAEFIVGTRGNLTDLQWAALNIHNVDAEPPSTAVMLSRLIGIARAITADIR